MKTIGISSMFRLAVILAALLIAASALRAETGSGDSISYRVKRGDTLIQLAQKYFVRSGDYRAVLKLNKISNPRKIPVGKRIAIPVSFLRSNNARLVIVSFTGPVELRKAGSASAPRQDAPISEGTEIITGRNGFISLGGDGGALVTLPSNSHVVVLKSRRYLINRALDLDFKVIDGRGGFRPHKLAPDDRYRVRTPLAVTSVRGTTFRIFHHATDEKSATQVDEGTVALSPNDSADQGRSIAEGFAAVATSDGIGATEALLPPVIVADPGRVRTKEIFAFALEPIEGAIAYHTELAADAAFIDVLSEKFSDMPKVSFEGIPNGRLYVRSRAIAASGVEGQTEAFSFRRQRLGVSALVEQGPLSDGFRFAWRQQGDGQTLFGFRLWKEGAGDRPLVFERAMQENSLTLSDLDEGTYFWSVGAVQGSDEGAVEVWGAPQKLTVSN